MATSRNDGVQQRSQAGWIGFQNVKLFLVGSKVRGLVKSSGEKLREALANLKRDPVQAGFIIISCVVLFLALGGTGSEWIYHHHGWSGARRSLNAKNYHRFGYIKTRLAPLDNVGAATKPDAAPEPMVKFRHHPPGFALLLSLVYAVFGESETVARLLAVALTMASLLMLIFIFRRSWGGWETLLGCVFLAFLPFYAGYLNFVNYETLVIFSMLAVIFTYESYRHDRKRWKLLLMALFIVIGVFSDYPFYPFLFYFWVVLAIIEFRDGIRAWKLPVIFAGTVLIAGSLLFLQVLGMQESFAAFQKLFLGRHILGAAEPIMLVLGKWNYYLWFFNPLTLVFAAYWVMDLAARAFLLKLRRADGYIAVLLLTGLTYWFLIPQGANAHEYAVFYLSHPLALAAAGGLWRFSKTISYGSGRVNLGVITAAALVFILTSIPHIYQKRISPVYQFTDPLHQIHSSKNYDLQLSCNIMARFMKAVMEPHEKIAVFTGFDIRPEFQYYFDRKHRGYNNRLDLLRIEKQKSDAFILVNQYEVWSDYLTHLIRKHDFVFHDRYYAFGLQKHISGTIFLKRVFEKTSLVAKYFRSLSYEKYAVEEDRWRGLDFAVKMRSPAVVQALMKEIGGAKPDTLHAQLARYNYNLSRGKKPDLAKLTKWLEVVPKRKTIFGKSIEYLGARLHKREDGRTVLQVLFKPIRVLDYNFKIELAQEPLHENEKLRKEIGARSREVRSVIPSMMWKTGYVYLIEDELQLFPGPYRLSFDVQWLDYFQVLNPESNENAFPVDCKVPFGDPFESIAQITSRMMEIDAQGPMDFEQVRKQLSDLPACKDLVMKEIGDDLILHGCSIVPASKDKWLLRLFFQNRSIHGRELHVAVFGTGPGDAGSFTKKMELGKMSGDRGPGHLFWVEETVETNLVEARIKISVGAKVMPVVLKTSYGITRIRISDGDYGIDFPLQWLNWTVDP